MPSKRCESGGKSLRARIILSLTLTALSACSAAKPADAVADTFSSQPRLIAAQAGDAAKPVAGKQVTPITTAASLDSSQVMTLRLGDVSLRVSAAACSEFTDTLTRCTKGASIVVHDPSRNIQQTLHPDQLWIDSQRTFYSGPLSDAGTPFAGDYSVIWADANSDAAADLIVHSGKDGSYGGPSFDVYLYASKHELVYNKALSDLTVGHNSLFTLEKGLISTSQTSGCCEHTQENYRFVNGTLTMIKRTTERSQ